MLKFLNSKLPFPLYPLTIALFPVLFMYWVNIKQVLEDTIFLSAAISILFAAFIYMTIKLLVKNSFIAAPLSWAFLVIFFSYNRLYSQIKDFQFSVGGDFIGPNKILIPVLLSIFILFAWFLFKKKQFLPTVNKFLSVFTVVLIAITLFNIVSYEFESKRLYFYFKNAGRAAENPISLKSTDTPDIYYLIFDRYSGEKTLKSYGYDNSAFLDFLRSKNFEVASQSNSNYPGTVYSLASTLSMEYLDFMDDEVGDRPFSEDRKSVV